MIDFTPLFYAALAIGVLIGLAIAGLVWLLIRLFL